MTQRWAHRAGWVVVGATLGALIASTAAAAPRMKFTMRFDWLTPAGMACVTDAPGAVVRDSRNIFDRPFISVIGDLSTVSITCTAPDGSRWRTGLPFARDIGDGPTFDGVATWRPGARRMYLYVTDSSDSLNHLGTTEVYRFTRLQEAAPDRRLDP